MSVPFRLIAIAPETAAVDAIAAMAGGPPAPTIAMMLRDREHDEANVAGLLAYARGRVASNILLMTNGVACEGVRWVHLPYQLLVHAARLSRRGLGVGVSVHSAEEALRAAPQASYLIASPIFPTPSKPGHRGLGLERLAEICAISPAPVFALGGIDAERAGACLALGAYGVAGITLFRSAAESARTVAAISQLDARSEHD